MKKLLLALGLACALPTGLAAEDAASEASLGTVTVLVLDEALPAAGCAKDTECMAVNRAVLTARTQKVSALRSRGRWI